MATTVLSREWGDEKSWNAFMPNPRGLVRNPG